MVTVSMLERIFWFLYWCAAVFGTVILAIHLRIVETFYEQCVRRLLAGRDENTMLIAWQATLGVSIITHFAIAFFFGWATQMRAVETALSPPMMYVFSHSLIGYLSMIVHGVIIFMSGVARTTLWMLAAFNHAPCLTCYAVSVAISIVEAW